MPYPTPEAIIDAPDANTDMMEPLGGIIEDAEPDFDMSQAVGRGICLGFFYIDGPRQRMAPDVSRIFRTPGAGLISPSA